VAADEVHAPRSSPVNRLRHGLLGVSATMRASDPVFIVGEARSGTSILYRTIQKHPRFQPRQPNLVETNIFVHLRRTFMFRLGYPSELIRFMLDDKREYASFLSTIRPVRVVSAALIPVNFALRDRFSWLWYANLSHLVVRSYFFHARRARGCPRLIEKTPTNTGNLARLKHCFPNARFLYVFRHPVEVLGSHRRRAVDDPEATWALTDLHAFYRNWRASTRRALAWREDHEDLLLVRYEEFTQTPEPALREMCSFLGEEFDADMAAETRPQVGRWRGDPHLWGPIVARTKRWSDYVSRDEACALGDRLGEEIEALGYDPLPV
jgi:hypothetical protein